MSEQTAASMEANTETNVLGNFFLALTEVEKNANNPKNSDKLYNNAVAATQLLKQATGKISDGHCPYGQVWNPNTGQCE